MRCSETQINWIGTALFATPDRRIALFYTQNKADGFSAEIDLIHPIKPDEPIDFLVIGGASLDEALEKLYGSPTAPPGYIYQLDGQHFVKEEGLGSMEAISYNPNSTIGKEPVSRRAEIQKYVDQGLVRLIWMPS